MFQGGIDVVILMFQGGIDVVILYYVVGVITVIGRFQSIKTGVLLIFSFITGDKTEFLSPMIILNEYITGI